MEREEGCEGSERSSIKVLREVHPRIEQGVTTTIEMDDRRALDLTVFLQSEIRRRRRDFEETDMMACWVCLGTAEDLLRALKNAGYRPAEGHL